MQAIYKIRARGIPCAGDAGYYRFGYWIPCGEAVALEVSPAVYEALRADPWLIIDDGAPPGESATVETDAASAAGAASAFTEESRDATSESTHRAVRQRGRRSRQ